MASPLLLLLLIPIAGTVTFFGTPVAKLLAGYLGMQDMPSGRKLHLKAMPHLGGLAILAGWAIVLAIPSVQGTAPAFIVCILALAALGFRDDRSHIDERLRLVIQVAIAAFAWWAGIRLTPTESVALDLPFTILWLVGITNAFNFMDNMDGLAAGTGAIAAGAFGVLGLLFGQPVIAASAFAFAGACLGYLGHNFHPARVFMGDTGSLSLGFGLAAMAAKLEFPGVEPLSAAAAPIIILGLLIVDTTVMTSGRLLRGEPVIGGRMDHLSHRLLGAGLSVRATVIRLYVLGAFFAIAGIGVSLTSSGFALSIMILVVAVGLAVLVAALGLSHIVADARGRLAPANGPSGIWAPLHRSRHLQGRLIRIMTITMVRRG